ncbi:hypothetical protein [Dongia sp.]|uniref:hypothetical protein n=1 Tax=Dongia sp. TaxID=1977262 RepID=UPI0035AEF1B6
MKTGDTRRSIVAKNLPLRLVPRRTRVMIWLVFVLAWCGMTFSSLVPALYAMYRPHLPWERVHSGGGDFFSAIFLTVGAVLLVRAVMAALPNSPYRYLEIDEEGLTRRDFSKLQYVAWKDIEWISVVERWQSRGKGRSRHWWVLAENSANAFEHDADRRIQAASLAYDANEFKPLIGGGGETAEQLVSLLREGLAKVKRGEPIIALPVPPLLQSLAVEMQMELPASEGRRNDGSTSAIER